MSEINAAFGLVQLKYIDQAIKKRKEIDEKYREALSKVNGITLSKLSPDSNSNHSYFPILIEKEFPLTRDELYDKLKSNNILSRKYFLSVNQQYANVSWLCFCYSRKFEACEHHF